MNLSPRYALGSLVLVLVGSLAMFAPSANATVKQTPYSTGRYNSGTPYSKIVVKNVHGVVTVYGDGAILYTLPPAAYAELGHALYQQNCASCHGNEANGHPDAGVPGIYPDLQHVGSATVTFWVDSGRMPASGPRNVQAIRKPHRLSPIQALSIAAWIDSLSTKPAVPYVMSVNLKGANVSNGAALFALNCAACHTITGDGDALAFGTYSPSLRNVPTNQVAEAIRTGPGNMPRFSGNLTDSQVRDIVAYVTEYIQHPTNPGGLGLGGLGPVAEGFIGLALGVGLLALAAFWVGERS